MVGHPGSKQTTEVWEAGACREFWMSALKLASSTPGQEAFDRKLKQWPAILLFTPF